MEDKMHNINPSRKRQLVQVNTYAHNWGILVPSNSGFIWEQQTDGVACSHIQVEGVYIPLREPNDLLAQLREANYNGKSTFNVWNDIRKIMNQCEKLKWVNVNNPKPNRFPENQEGIQWIRIIDWDSLSGGRELIGETVILIYPNCD